MVDVLESLQGFAEQSIVVAERRTANLAPGRVKIKWICCNVSEHSSRQKVIVDEVMLDGREAVCPECGRALVRVESVVSL